MTRRAIVALAAAADPDRYLFFATRNRVPSGSIATAVAGANYIATKIKVGCPQYKTRTFRFHFSGFALTEGGNSPQETVVTGTIGTPGNSTVIDEFLVRYNGTFYPCTFNGGAAGVTIADQSNGAWTDALTISGDVAAEADLELWTFYHVAVGEKFYPVYRVQKHRGERVWGASDLASAQAFKATPDAASSAVLDTNYGGQTQPQFYGPDFMVAKGDWDGRPVALCTVDSIGEARQEFGPVADDRGNLGWLRRWLDKNGGLGRVPHFMMGVPGAAALRELTGSGSTIATRRWAVLDEIAAFNAGKKAFTVIASQLGQNDSTTPYSSYLSRLTAFKARVSARYPGVKFVQFVPVGRVGNNLQYKDVAAVTYAANNVWPVDATDASAKWRLRDAILAKTNLCDDFIDTLDAWQGAAGVAKPPTFDELPWSAVTAQAGSDGVATYTSIEVADGSIYQSEQMIHTYAPDGVTPLSQANVASVAGNVLTLTALRSVVLPVGSRVYQYPVNASDGLHPMPALIRRMVGRLPQSEKAKLAA